MTQNSKETKSTRRRTQANDLPRAEKQLTPEEAKGVKGGAKMIQPALEGPLVIGDTAGAKGDGTPETDAINPFK